MCVCCLSTGPVGVPQFGLAVILYSDAIRELFAIEGGSATTNRGSFLVHDGSLVSKVGIVLNYKGYQDRDIIGKNVLIAPSPHRLVDDGSTNVLWMVTALVVMFVVPNELHDILGWASHSTGRETLPLGTSALVGLGNGRGHQVLEKRQTGLYDERRTRNHRGSETHGEME